MRKSNMKRSTKANGKTDQLKSSKKSTLSVTTKRLAVNHNEILLRA